MPELVRGGMPDAAAYWTVPAGFVREGAEGAVIVTVLTDDQPRIGLTAGDRIVIDGDFGHSAGKLLVWSDGCLSVVEDVPSASGSNGSADETILGRIVATIRNGSAGLS